MRGVEIPDGCCQPVASANKSDDTTLIMSPKGSGANQCMPPRSTHVTASMLTWKAAGGVKAAPEVWLGTAFATAVGSSLMLLKMAANSKTGSFRTESCREASRSRSWTGFLRSTSSGVCSSTGLPAFSGVAAGLNLSCLACSAQQQKSSAGIKWMCDSATRLCMYCGNLRF